MARSLTLFHAGKVYDYMENIGMDDIGEVVILDPIHNRFVILNSNYLATRVEFGELRQYLNVGEHEAELYLQELITSDDRQARRANALRLPGRSRRRPARLSFSLPPWDT